MSVFAVSFAVYTLVIVAIGIASVQQRFGPRNFAFQALRRLDVFGMVFLVRAKQCGR